MSLRTISITLGILVLFTGLATVNFANVAPADHQYVGVSSCKGCHSNDKMGGTEYKVWADGAHAGAFATLGTDEAKKIAADAGVEGNPQESGDCLKCHVTAWGVEADLKGKNLKNDDGVGCESCHGAGKDYMPMKVMKDHDASIAAGLKVPDKETCTGCHNEESPTFVEFKYEEQLKEIKHWE